MSKKAKESTIRSKSKGGAIEDKDELYHEKKWFNETARSPKTTQIDPAPQSRQNESTIFKDICEELFRNLTDDVQNNKLKHLKCGKDLFRHILHLTDNTFTCCDDKKRTFDEYVEHRVSNCKKMIILENKKGDQKRSVQNDEKDAIDDLTSLNTTSRYTNDSYNTEEQITYKSKGNKKYLSCSVKNCRKKFKSINGLKYHSKHGHKNPNDVIKSYKCNFAGCKKKYKNQNGLKYHNEHGHKKMRD